MRLRAIYPKFYVKSLEENLKYARIKASVDKFLSSCFKLSLVLSFLVGIALFFLKLSLPLVFIGFFVCFLATHFAILAAVFSLADRVADACEEVFPDVLQLIASNLRVGLIPERALILAARPEFGIMEEEIRDVAKKVTAGTPIEDAIVGIGKRIKSKIISKTLSLIVEGIRKGGELAALLERTGEDIRYSRILRKEVASQVMMYVIFIFLAVGIFSPLLFAVSLHLLKTIIQIGQIMQVPKIQAMGGESIGFMTFTGIGVSVEFMKSFTLVAMFITSFFGSILLGLLKGGKEIAGIKYIPLFLALNLAIYFGAGILLERFLVAFLPPLT